MKDQVYATATRPGSTDEAIDYFVNQLGMCMALSDLLSSKVPTTLPTIVWAARYVGQETIVGELCDHIAVRESRTDRQVWVTRGDPP